MRRQEASANRLSHGEFPELIRQDELNVRLERKLGRRPQALGYEANKAGFTVFYRSIFDLVRDFRKDEAFNQQDKTLRKYLKPDLVIIDDMGLKALPKHSGEYLREAVLRRYEKSLDDHDQQSASGRMGQAFE